jgi:branched-chain amino acid transport system substrate-binding protein
MVKLVANSRFRLIPRAAAIGLAVTAMVGAPAVAQETIKVGLVAALSGQSAKSGEAITRGLEVAIDEINGGGGVLGKKIELIRRDDESNPAKGVVAARELVQKEKVVAFFGGIDTPVSLAIVPFANQAKVPFIAVWAAGTAITRNAAPENYVFRVSAVDELVDQAMVDHAIKTHKTAKPGLMLINNSWGESNETGLKAAAAAQKLTVAGAEKFGNDDVDMVPQLSRLKDAGADTIFLVANVQPAAQVVKSLVRMNWDVPVVSHWGPAGGRFTELGGPAAEKVHMVQTYSFSGTLSNRGQKVLAELKAKYPQITTLADVTPAVGIANAYDAMHLLALAIAKAGATDGPSLRKGLYAIGAYEGLIKSYNKPFSPDNQDALGKSDYMFTHFKGAEIVPLN